MCSIVYCYVCIRIVYTCACIIYFDASPQYVSADTHFHLMPAIITCNYLKVKKLELGNA